MARTRKTLTFNGDWASNAACHDVTGLFYPADGEQAVDRVIRETEAKRICRRCPVRIDCLAEALARPEKHGVWGGMNELERKYEIRRRVRRAVA